MSTRAATILAVVVALFVIGGTALAIGSQFGVPEAATAQAADSPNLPAADPTSARVTSGITTLSLPDAQDLDVAPPPTSLTPSTSTPVTNSESSTTTSPSTTSTTAASTTTTTSSPTTTTVPPTTTTTTAPTTTTTTAPVTTTTTAPATTTTTVPVTTTTTTAPTGGSFSAAKESQFVSLINGVRTDLGLPVLTVSSSLNSYARDWTFHMSDTNTFEHSNIGSLLGPWSTVGENIAYGWSVTSMHNALVDSPGHYGNLTSPNFTHIGVGVWVEEGGKIWTTHVFGG